MDDRKLSPGEQLVWAARFALVTQGGGTAPLAVRLATRTIQQLREVDVQELPEDQRVALEQIRGGL